MNFYIPASLYRLMDFGLLLQTIRILGRQGPACLRFIECLERLPSDEIIRAAA